MSFHEPLPNDTSCGQPATDGSLNTVSSFLANLTLSRGITGLWTTSIAKLVTALNNTERNPQLRRDTAAAASHAHLRTLPQPHLVPPARPRARPKPSRDFLGWVWGRGRGFDNFRGG